MYQQQIPQINFGNYYPQTARQPQNLNPQGLKGRPVSSLEEVRATMVDFDGSISYFPNLANDTIYTKQINLDGTSSIKIYELVDTPPTASQNLLNNLVTKEEFAKTINNLLEQIALLKTQKNETEIKESEQANPSLQQPTFDF